MDTDVLILMLQTPQPQNKWTPVLDKWKAYQDPKKMGRLFCIEIPSSLNDKEGFVLVLKDLVSGLGLQPVDVVTDRETTSFGLALAMNSEEVKRLAILDPGPLQWEESAKKLSLKDLHSDVLILQGAFDQNSPKASAKDLAKSLPQAKLQELKIASAESIFKELNQFFI